MASSRARLRGLYAITPETADTASLVARARLALEGGARLLQYRAKSLDPATALDQARRLAAECRRAGALFIVNDSVDLALAAEADGVHLGRDDTGIATARARLPAGIVGVSCYADPQSARAAAAAGADYVAIGSVHPSRTKPAAVRAPLEAIAAAGRASGLPVAAIGGITPANAPSLVRAGADMLAVISALFDAEDVRAAARALTRPFDAREAAPKEETPDVRAQPRPL
ncbi:MAG TPA: thiamine phosphate synthase [Usitatibacter sp.]|jgi:thiamine-phosphate pyrophosphorylase|nr:thiamine phosphate synthase [Usitatibacter sp.]